ncbi:TPA: hypothetical protein O5K13_000477 [Staphylococcus aureus]|nr:hypothetical protein [Staphylococcus aureus]
MPNKNYKVCGYRIITKKFLSRKPYEKDSFDVLDLEMFIYLINQLWQTSKKFEFENKNGNGKKLFYIDEIIENNDEYVFGKFKTGSFGITESFKDSYTNKVTYNKKEHEASDDDVFFYIGKKYGEILIGNDPNNSITKQSLHKYFKKFEPLLEDYLIKFNEINKKNYQIYKKRMFSILNLPLIDFFEEIEKFDKVKSGSFVLNEKDITDTIDVNDKLKELDEQIDINNNDVEIEIKLKNISSKKLIKQYKKLYEILSKLDIYEDFKVQGQYREGSTQTITRKLPVRSFDTKVDFGSKKYPTNYVQVKNEFIKVCSENQLMFGKAFPTKNINNLSKNEIKEVKKLIDKKAHKENLISIVKKGDEKFLNEKIRKVLIGFADYKNDFRSLQYKN